MASAPIILVPGFWLGAWAWDDVVARLEAAGHHATALTLPGLEPDADRTTVHFQDHVDAIADAVEAAGEPVVLAVHSARGYAGYAVADRIPDRIAHLVYVDSAPGKGAMDPEFADADKPLMSQEELEAEENLDGLSEAQLAEFRRRAVPEPGATLREGVELTNDARRDVPSTIICTGFPSDKVKAAVEDGYSWLAGIPELRNVTWVDLPTSHWPMWSKPAELAERLGDIAVQAGTPD
jgi:pimeloyl-ACP methyl ester carboxylesterase